jgi:1,4-alpha-glucan branching enzyme
MVKKSYSKTKRSCRVTFEMPQQAKAKRVALCGEFNDWDPSANLMKQRKDGRFSTTVSMEAGRSYRFKYLVDNQRWENDSAADSYVPNEFGSEDSLIRI